MRQGGNRLFKINHEEPNDFRMDFVLLPYGEYYKKTSVLLDAKPGDTLRFFNGRDVEIQAVSIVDGSSLCNILCRMRYGVPWGTALSVWRGYAVMEGNGKDILVDDKCIIVAFKWPE